MADRRYHVNHAFLSAPISVGDFRLVQIGRLHCEPNGTVPPHLHGELFELTVVSDGKGSVITNGVAVPVRRGDVYLSFPGDLHEIRSDGDDPLKYEFFSFYPKRDADRLALEQIVLRSPSPRERTVRDHRIEEAVSNALAEVRSPEDGSEELTAALFRQVFCYLVRAFRQEPSFCPAHVGTAEELCYRIMQYVDTHLYSMESLCGLGEVFRYHYSYLSELFHRVTGDTLKHYYDSRRLLAAETLLREGTLSVTQIAEQLRYGSVYSFSRAFRRRCGCSPSQFRASPPPS